MLDASIQKKKNRKRQLSGDGKKWMVGQAKGLKNAKAN
jgi:hypothetical protein